jgi:hypothetical protein
MRYAFDWHLAVHSRIKSIQLCEHLFKPLQGLLAYNGRPLTNRNANIIKMQHIKLYLRGRHYRRSHRTRAERLL